MMKKVIALLSVTVLLMGCTHEPYYVDTLVESIDAPFGAVVEAYRVTSYNGYRLKDKTETKNEDGRITITLEFVPSHEQGCEDCDSNK